MTIGRHAVPCLAGLLCPEWDPLVLECHSGILHRKIYPQCQAIKCSLSNCRCTVHTDTSNHLLPEVVWLRADTVSLRLVNLLTSQVSEVLNLPLSRIYRPSIVCIDAYPSYSCNLNTLWVHVLADWPCNLIHMSIYPAIWLVSTLQVALLSWSILDSLCSSREYSCLTV